MANKALISLMISAAHLPIEKGGCGGCFGQSGCLFMFLLCPFVCIYYFAIGDKYTGLLYTIPSVLLLIIIIYAIMSPYLEEKKNKHILDLMDYRIEHEWKSDDFVIVDRGYEKDLKYKFYVECKVKNKPEERSFYICGTDFEDLDKEIRSEIEIRRNDSNKTTI